MSTEAASSANEHPLWLLALVPKRRHGRWITAGAILAVGAAVYGFAAWLTTQPDYQDQTLGVSVVAFFVAAVAYVLPVFHYITERTGEALDRLAPHLPPELLTTTRRSLTHKRFSWMFRSAVAATGLWLVQSRLLAGSWQYMIERVGEGYVAIVMDFGPLPVWLVTTTATRALVVNALSFRRIAREVHADLFCPQTFMPVGAMAVTSTLFLLGAIALLPVMWLGGPISWWTTLPALMFLVPTVLLLLLLPVWPLHRRLLAQRREALVGAQAAIDEARGQVPIRGAVPSVALVDALALRREVSRLPVWPFDIGALTRLLGYSVIVPLTWAGAALIEMLVNMIVA